MVSVHTKSESDNALQRYGHLKFSKLWGRSPVVGRQYSYFLHSCHIFLFRHISGTDAGVKRSTIDNRLKYETNVLWVTGLNPVTYQCFSPLRDAEVNLMLQQQSQPAIRERITWCPTVHRTGTRWCSEWCQNWDDFGLCFVCDCEWRARRSSKDNSGDCNLLCTQRRF